MTLARAVAEAHVAEGPTTRAAHILRRTVPLEALLMTFWETPALSRVYREAEAVVLGG
jgi:hypothetical protein